MFTEMISEGEVPVYESPLERYLTGALPVEIDDPCVSSLILLRCLYALNRFWWSLFEDEDVPPTTHAPLLPPTYVPRLSLLHLSSYPSRSPAFSRLFFFSAF